MDKKHNKRNKILFTIMVLTIIIIIIIPYLNIGHTEKEKPISEANRNITIDPSNNNPYISSYEEFDYIMNSLAEEYKDAADDIDKNTSIDENGKITYYKDYMTSDYEELDIGYLRDFSYENNQFLESDFKGTNLYCLLLFALKDIFRDTPEIFICNTDKVETIKPGFIFRCHAKSESHTATVLIDASNYKIHIEKYE